VTVVGGGPLDTPGVGNFVRAVNAETKVCQLDLVAGCQENVFRLDIAVNHSLVGQGKKGSGRVTCECLV
jgi:hypothetical protein